VSVPEAYRAAANGEIVVKLTSEIVGNHEVAIKIVDLEGEKKPE